MKEKAVTFIKQTSTRSKTAFDSIDTVTRTATREIDSYLAPTRKSILKRFPVLFSLLATFGLVMTFLGFEKIVSQITFLDQNPLVMLILGVSILAATGTLYKKLK